MNNLHAIALAAVCVAGLLDTATEASAQVSVNIGVEPACPYGYFDYAPYACAPYGYYGPAWFTAGVFLGAGPWYRGPRHWRGHVDNRVDVRNGYRGPLPQHGERPDPARPLDRMDEFRGNEMREGGASHGGGRR